MLSLEDQIRNANSKKVENKIKVVRGTRERYDSTQKELEKLKQKRDNLNVQIQALEAKQAARRKQLENMV
jgi:BMFP domain-containing protein YqiC